MRDPTRYVVFTVVVGLESSGANSTRSPLPSAYSVMPSTLVTFVTPAGSGGSAAKAAGANATRTETNRVLRIFMAWARGRERHGSYRPRPVAQNRFSRAPAPGRR